jgi:hypothetical protein
MISRYSHKSYLLNNIALSTTAQLLSNDSVWESSVNIHNSAEDELNRFGNHSQDHSLKLAISSKDNAAWQTDHFQKGYPYPINTSSISPISVSPSTPSFSVSFSPTSSSGSISPRNLSEASVQSFSSASEQPSSRRSAQTQKTDSYFSNFDVEQGYKPKTTQASSGRKRRIVFEGDDAEERRQKFLERNRVAGMSFFFSISEIYF